MTLEELQRILVQELGILDKAALRQALGLHKTAQSLLDHLVNKKDASHKLSIVTTYQRSLIEKGQASRLVLEIEGQQYLKLMRLGKGAFGKVYLSRKIHPAKPDLYAIKVATKSEAVAVNQREIEQLR